MKLRNNLLIGSKLLEAFKRHLTIDQVCRTARCSFITLGLLVFCHTGEAEEQPNTGDFHPGPLFDEHAFTSQGAASFVVSLAAEPATSPNQQPFHLLETFHLAALFKKVACEDDLESDSSVTLFRKPTHSRFAYHTWAGFRTGYGQCLSNISMDSFARSRTNGVGVEDPDFLYVKMSVRF